MYAYLKGVVAELSTNEMIFEVNGVGYKIEIPLHLFAKAQVGEKMKLYTSFVVREDSQRLFGFAKEDEKVFFEKLSSISGIGPKTALTLIGHMDQINLPRAIQTNDVKALSSIPGIGKKTAERIILELTTHIEKLTLKRSPEDTLLIDAQSALTNLGYNNIAAQKALQKVLKSHKEKSLSLTSLITAALQQI